MTYKLRAYQAEAVNSVYDYFRRERGNPIVVLPTGCGKSLVIAEFIRTALLNWPETRIVVAVHSKDLVAQNHAELFALCPEVRAGIYSAGLGRRDVRFPVLFAGIQSVYKQAAALGHIDILMVDECHSISEESETRWAQFIGDLRQINPLLKVVGLSATPFRMNSGSLTNGKLFSKIIYDYGILRAISEGYLVPLVARDMQTKLSVDGVHKRGGEFIAGELEAAVDKDSITRAAVAEIVKHGSNRKTWLLFCSGVKHTEHVAAVVREHGIECEAVTGETPTAQRDSALARFKSGQLRAVANPNIWTTGLNVPRVDLIAMLRPTGSAGLYVQMAGRGSRCFPDKTNCLVLDHAGNTARHGPIDMVKVREPGQQGGEAPIKVCPTCSAIVYAGVRVCPECGFEFPWEAAKIETKASEEALLSTHVAPKPLLVGEVLYNKHEKPGRPPSLRVSYKCGLNRVSEWICLEHSGYAREKAAAWWRRRTSDVPVPSRVDDALESVTALREPSAILVKRNGQFDEIVGYEW